LAWKYGIINDIFRPKFSGINSIQELALDMWKKGETMSEIIHEFTREKTQEEREGEIITPRKYCKKLPFLFTPAMYQLLLLGISKDEMKKIHKCRYDQIMGRVDFPVVREKISELHTLDWRNEYYKFMINPYAFYNIPLDKCDFVIVNSGRLLSDFVYERHLGEISRFVYRNTKDNRWTATPDWLMKKEYSNYIEFQDILRDNYGLVFDIELTYLRHVHAEEEQVASFILYNIYLQTLTFGIKYSNDFVPTEEQDNAIRGSLSRSTSIITGLAGVGKSTVVKEIVRQIRNQNLEFIVCSFTAKAVKRVREILGDLAYTELQDKIIWHVRTIERGTLTRPDYLIIDEATMVSLSLLAHLLRLFRNKSVTLIMLGDINQLPSIKYGRPFEDIINSGLVHIHTLTKNLRVHGGIDDPIIVNSTNIIRAPIYTVQQANNFILIKYRSPADIQDIIRNNNITLENIKEHKFITAMNDDNTELNRILSSLLNNRSAKESRNISCLTNRKDTYGKKIAVEMKYSIGDPVIFTKNHIYKYVSNGCERIIVGVANDCIIVDANGYNIPVPLHPIRNRPDVFTVKNMLLAYSITVHKSQGSQWRNVYYYIRGSPSKKFLNKRLTYTAITRACEKCTIIESEQNLFTLCCGQQINMHYGGLLNRIRSATNTKIISGTPKSYIETTKQNINDMMTKLNINQASNIVLC